MNNVQYCRAYKEVFEIIKYFPEEEYSKIPKDKIEFIKENMDPNYEFTIDPLIDLSKQNISKEANSIIIVLFKDYFATEKQKKQIDEILKLNQEKVEQEKSQKYNCDDLFESQNNNRPICNDNINEKSLIEYKEESFFEKFKNFVLKLLHYKKS